MPPRTTAPFTYFSTPQYPSDDEDNTPPPLAPVAPTHPGNVVGQRHVLLNHTGGSRNVYLPSIASPAAASHVLHRSDHESNWNMEPPAPVIDFYELYPFADPSYQHAMDIMDPEVVPRRRTKSVSYFCGPRCNSKAHASLKGSPLAQLDSGY